MDRFKQHQRLQRFTRPFKGLFKTLRTCPIALLFRHWGSRAIALFLCLGLLGCVDYDIAVHYTGQYQGEIVQHIEVGQQLTRFGGTATQDWLTSLEQRATQLGGKAYRASNNALTVTIPFHNGEEFQDRFNEFFQSAVQSASSRPDLPEIQSHLTLTETNLLLLVKNHLVYDLDLRSLAVLSATGTVLVNPGSSVNLRFSLTTPWGGEGVAIIGDRTVPAEVEETQLTWMLQAGTQNHLEAIFWVPSPLGIGTVAIAAFVALGSLLKRLITPNY